MSKPTQADLTGGSLSGQNKGRRAAGVGSSPTLPTLWKLLRKLDRQFYFANKNCRILGWAGLGLSPGVSAIDAKRKAVRQQMKDIGKKGGVAT